MFTSATATLSRSLGMSRLKIFLMSAALMMAPQSTLSGSTPVTTGAAVTVGLGDASGLADASAGPLALGAGRRAFRP